MQSLDIEKITLTVGAHAESSKQFCIMELVSYLANEPWSDHPQCSCEALTAYAIRLNDRGDAEMREKLKALAPRLVGTRDGKRRERAHFMVLRSITVMLPILTDALGLTDISARLSEFKTGEWIEARDYIQSIRPILKEAARKHADAAAYAAAYAADAAADAAYAAAYAAAAYAAYAADAYAAYAAAAAADAAYAAAYAAAAYAAAAAAYAKNKEFWVKIRKDTMAAAFETLELAIVI